MRGTVHHIDLTVTDPEASFAVFDAALSFLGYAVNHRSVEGIEWTLHGDDTEHSVSLVPARGDHADRRHDRYSSGLHHVAWWAGSREDVDQAHAVLIAAGVEILDPPAEYPQYNRGRGYYAVFFTEPDGLRLEICWTPER